MGPGQKTPDLQDAQGIDIRGRVGRYPGQLRRGQENDRPQHLPLPGQAEAVGQVFPQPEIDELDPLGGDDDIGRLEIPVDNSPAMQESHGIHHLQEERQGFLRGPVQVRVKGPPLQPLHGQVVLPAGDPDLEKFDDVGVFQPGEDLSLVLEPLEALRVDRPVRQDLDRYLAVGQGGIPGLVDHSHPALRHLLLQHQAVEQALKFIRAKRQLEETRMLVVAGKETKESKLDRLGMTVQQISNYETGRSRVPRVVELAIMYFLDRENFDETVFREDWDRADMEAYDAL